MDGSRKGLGESSATIEIFVKEKKSLFPTPRRLESEDKSFVPLKIH